MNHYLVSFWSLISKLPMTGYMRGCIIKKMGVKINAPKHFHVFIGSGVSIDNLYPEYIEIGDWTTIASGTHVISHFMNTGREKPGFEFHPGHVKIGSGVFIGAGCIICNAVTIGDNAIVGAGSVITKNIPAGEIWVGNPARFIKKRPLETFEL